MSNTITEKVKEYEAWRFKLATTIADYRAWLMKSQLSDSIKELRLYDVMQSIKSDQILTAFIGDSANGKTELINALFFSSYGLRLLPSDTARTCSFEILWSKDTEPSLSLLPIDTKKTDDTITYLKTSTNIWEKFKLDEHSPSKMQETLSKVAEQKEITQTKADELGLWDPMDKAMAKELDEYGYISVPAWRHAVINIPHPVLESGLVIFDTSTVGKSGGEPEVSLNTIPNADAVVLVTEADEEVKTADQRIWDHHVKNRTKNKLIVLNKIDRLWGAKQSAQNTKNEISRHINVMAHHLHIAPDEVFPLSAREAVNAKLQDSKSLLEKSQIDQFEQQLADLIVTAKKEKLGDTVARECSEMIKVSRKSLQSRINSLRNQIEELKNLQGKNIDESKAMLAKVVAERKRYEASIPTFNKANEKITTRGEKLLNYLSATYLDTSISESRREIKKSWTTVALNKGMRNVMKQSTELANQVISESNKIKNLADNIYGVFQTKHGFDEFEVPTLDISHFLNDMHDLEKVTDDFCKNPINVMTEKFFLVRKFFLSLGAETQKVFEQNRLHCEDWLNNVMSRLEVQMAEHKKTLEERTQNLLEAKESERSLEDQLASIENEYDSLNQQSQALDDMLLNVMTAMQPALKAEKAAKSFGLNENQKMPELSFLNNQS